MAEIDPLIFEMILEQKRFQADLRSATRSVDEHLGLVDGRIRKLGQNTAGVMSLAKTAALGFVGAIGVDAITSAISRALDYASSLGEVAQQLGVTTDALQEYRYAATQAGLSQEDMDMALSQLTRRIGEAASGTKAQAAAFEALGISVRDAEGNIVQAGDAIPLIADAMQKIESPAERAALLMDLFGKSGQKLEPLLAGGAAGVNNLRDAAQKLGIVLSSQQIQSADDAADKLAAVKQVLEARLAGTVADNADEIVALANALANLADKAFKAMRALREFVSADQARGSYLKSANAYLDSRKDLTPQQRQQAAGIVTRRYDQREGWRQVGPRDPTGLFNLRTRLAGDDMRLAPTELQRILGATQGGRLPIDKLLGDGRTPPATAMTRVADTMSTELQRLEADLALATAELTGSIQARADAEKQKIDADLAAEIERLKADEGLKEAERNKRIAVEQQTAAAERLAVDRRAAADFAEQERRAQERVLEQRLDGLRDDARTLEAQARIALTAAERRDIDQRILAIQQQEERERLDAAVAAGEIADAAQARANLETRQNAERVGLAQQNQGALGRYADNAADYETRLEEAATRKIADLNRTISDSMARALGVKDPFLSELISVFLDRNIFGPIADALSKQGGGGGLGGFINAIGSLFGGPRARGGPVNSRQMFLVGERGPELFVPPSAGNIMPNHQLAAISHMASVPLARPGGAAGGIATVRLELSGDIDARIANVSGGVAVEIVRQAAPTLIDAASNETMRRAGRPTL